MPDPKQSSASPFPDPRTARDDDEDATNHGVSATEPAEGADAERDEGSPAG